MTARSRNSFVTVRSEGAILPADLLRRIVDGDPGLGGLTPAAYHLLEGERINEAINRSWSRLLGFWASFRSAVAKLPPNDAATGVTRERWLLPLFQELGYGRLQTAKAIERNGKQYAISHTWGHALIHLVGCRVDLDRRTPGVAGAAKGSPHSLVQEALNGADDHLWGFVSNGLRLRVLRDNVRLTRQAYVEFDLEAMFEGRVYADFALLWLVCHQSRVEAERPDQCWLERWSRAAQEQGVRALDKLRNGVEQAITALGCGFLAHPANSALRERLRSGALTAQDYYRQVLRLVYRLLFLFVAEERDLLLDPQASADARERYTRYYAITGLRRLAERRTGTRHADLYARVWLVTRLLGSDEGAPGLGLPALGGFLFSSAALPDLEMAELANHDLLDAIRALAFIQDRHGRRMVDYHPARRLKSRAPAAKPACAGWTRRYWMICSNLDLFNPQIDRFRSRSRLHPLHPCLPPLTSHLPPLTSHPSPKGAQAQRRPLPTPHSLVYNIFTGHNDQKGGRVETINVADAEERLSELLSRVTAGERFLIQRRERPVAVLIAADELERLERNARVARRLAAALGQDEQLLEAIEQGAVHPAMAAFGLWHDDSDTADLAERLAANRASQPTRPDRNDEDS